MARKVNQAGPSSDNDKTELKPCREQKILIVETESPQKSATHFHDPLPMDSGFYGWLVCLASFWTNGTIFGTINSYGVLYMKLLEKFEGTENAGLRISLVGSLCVGMTFLFSPIAGICTDRFGIRKTCLAGSILATVGMLLSSFVNELEYLYITYGLMLGTGASLAYTPSLVILGHYFKKQMGFVNGIVTFGSSVFTVALPFILTWLLDHTGLQETMQILSGMMATLILCSLVFRPRLLTPRDSHGSENGSAALLGALSGRDRNHRTWCLKCRNFCAKFVNLTIWKNKKYVIWAFTIPVALFGYFVPYVHLVKYAKDVHPEREDGFILLICIGLTSGVGRIVFGKLADFPCVDRIFLQQLSFFCIGVLTIVLPFVTSSFEALIAICLGLGLFDGCFISLLGPIAFDITGPQGASQAIGFLLGLCSVPLTAGPPIAGWMHDQMNTYNVAFICAGIPPIVGACVMYSIKFVKAPPVKMDVSNAVQIVDCRKGDDGAGDEATKLMPDANNPEVMQKRRPSNNTNEKLLRSQSWNENINTGAPKGRVPRPMPLSDITFLSEPNNLQQKQQQQQKSTTIVTPQSQPDEEDDDETTPAAADKTLLERESTV